jgi:hypothetical protein
MSIAYGVAELMSSDKETFSKHKGAAFHQLSPSIHWAQEYRILCDNHLTRCQSSYDFELLHVLHGEVSVHWNQKMAESINIHED